jgi:hypothetical protein
VGCTIRVVLQTLYLRRNGILGTLEIDYAIVLPVATTDVASCNSPVVVTSAIPGLVFQQRRVRRALVQFVVNDTNNMAATW